MTDTASIAPDLDLFAEIARLKREKNAVLLAHYYQEADIQDLADFIGDSLALSQQAATTDADIIVFAGVHFMAETAKIVNPTKKVIIPDMAAGCSLADNCPADKFEAWLKQYPDHTVISYINCSAAVKALSDIICTSSNAVHIVNSLPADAKIVFAPDQHLGRYVMKKTGRDMVLWPGSCQVHEIFSEKRIVQLKTRHPEAKVIAHPECTEEVLKLADYIGSTSGLLKYTQTDPAKSFIVVTESGILHQMKKAVPNKEFIAGPPEDESCSCNECPYMRLNTIEKLYLCLRDEQPELHMDEHLRQAALQPIQRMLDLSKAIK